MVEKIGTARVNNMKSNCWEFKKCGRQPGGKHAEKLGVCPVTLEEKLDGIHNGINAGRACWVVSGTFCGGEMQGTFAQKYKSCITCDFYKVVRREEFPDFELAVALLLKLKDDKDTPVAVHKQDVSLQL